MSTPLHGTAKYPTNHASSHSTSLAEEKKAEMSGRTITVIKKNDAKSSVCAKVASFIAAFGIMGFAVVYATPVLNSDRPYLFIPMILGAGGAFACLMMKAGAPGM